MGGAHSLTGEPVPPEALRDAWVIDCANDITGSYREAAGLLLYRVFGDVEETPAAYARLDALARTLAACLAGAAPERDGWEHPHAPPARLYVMCTQGLNRSGLVTGRILRALGLTGDEALGLIRTHRPTALNNLTFARLVREG